MSAARTKSKTSTTKQTDKESKPKVVRCRDCDNEIPDTDGISYVGIIPFLLDKTILSGLMN